MTDYKKLYEEAIFRMNKWVEGSEIIDPKEVAEFVFPELKESEDELMRKEAISIIKQYNIICEREGDKCYTADRVIAWLEKQSKLEDKGNKDKQHLYDTIAALWDLLDKIDTFSDLQIDDTRTHNPFRKIEGIAQERHKFVKSDGYDLFIEGEKITDFKHQDEQKSTNIEPKFKVGDWVINKHGFVMQIVAVQDSHYIYMYEGKELSATIEQMENSCHLWTIQDVKDGDVLVYEGEIFIIKFYVLWHKIVYHCCYDGKNLYKHSIYDSWRKEDFDKVHPATKEQRELLFTKMKEAGYEWDADKKELKKIEQKDEKSKMTPFEKEVSEIIDEAIEDDKGLFNVCEKLLSLAKDEIEQKPAWSEEDEKMIESALQFAHEYGRHGLWFWLKSLKDRI